MSIRTEDILEALRGDYDEDAQGQYRADCPHHESKSGRSLHILDDGGRAILYCFAGCAYEEIVADLGLQSGNGAREKAEDAPKVCRTEELPKGVALFEFKDSNGKTLYAQAHKGAFYRPIGRGLWVANLDGVVRVPYNLPGLVWP